MSLKAGDWVLVVYAETSSFAILRWCLRPGFRHCFAIVQSGSFWVLLDGLSNKFDVGVISSDGLVSYLKRLHAKGYRVQAVRVQKPYRSNLRLSLFTCTETVKRLIGISGAKIQTPFQLSTWIERNRLTKRTKIE